MHRLNLRERTLRPYLNRCVPPEFHRLTVPRVDLQCRRLPFAISVPRLASAVPTDSNLMASRVRSAVVAKRWRARAQAAPPQSYFVHDVHLRRLRNPSPKALSRSLRTWRTMCCRLLPQRERLFVCGRSAQLQFGFGSGCSRAVTARDLRYT